jgi:hypothetical protein
MVDVDRLLHVLDGVGVEGPLQLEIAVGGHHDAGNFRILVEDAGDEPVPVQAGHLEVRDQGDDPVFLQNAQGLLAVAGGEIADSVVVLLQAVLQGFQEGRIIVNQENLFHAAPLR